MTKADNSNINIIVVDDESIVLSLIRDALEDDEYQLDTALSAAEALKIIEEKKIDLIISDIRMPKMNGIELVKRTRQTHPDVAVIFMTGYANLNSAKDAIKQGASDYILKPFELTEMRQAVTKAVDRIKRGEAVKQSSVQLKKLSDLNEMLFTAGDRKSLITSSLKYALMHCSSDSGAMLYWDRERTRFDLLQLDSGRISEQQLPRELLLPAMENIKPEDVQHPTIFSRIEDLPLGQGDAALMPAEFLSGNHWADGRILMVPVARQTAVYCFMLICVPPDSVPIDESGQRLLSIAASQLSMSLENLDLLQETQQAYDQLKALQDETIQLEKMATRGEMSAEIGHELNNFLGVVSGNLSLLELQLDKKNFGELQKYVTVMTDTVGKMKKFTANLMELSPISTKKEVFYFDKLITEVIDYLKPQKRFDGVKIIVHPFTEAIPLEADIVHIQQVLYNLFNNAADATCGCNTRQIIVDVATDTNKGNFRVAISDSGVGIQPEFLSKVFKEKFTTKEKGHGFGLMVCNRIIDGHGGKLTVDSSPGEGTTFYVDLPLKKKPDPVPAMGLPVLT